MKGKGIKIQGWVFPNLKFIVIKKPKSRLSHLSGNLWINFLLKVYCKYEALGKYVLNGTTWTVDMNETTEFSKIWSQSRNTSTLNWRAPRSAGVYVADHCLLLSTSFFGTTKFSPSSHSFFFFFLYRQDTGRGNYICCDLNVCVPLTPKIHMLKT